MNFESVISTRVTSVTGTAYQSVFHPR